MITVTPNVAGLSVGPVSTSLPVSSAPPTQASESTFQSVLEQVAQVQSNAPPIPVASAEVSLSSVSNPLPAETMLTTQATAPAASLSAELRNCIAWQGEQINPVSGKAIADTWAMQGITDPFSNATVLQQAQDILSRTENRKALNPDYTAEWTGDWRTQMAQRKAAETARQTLLAATDAANGVVVG